MKILLLLAVLSVVLTGCTGVRSYTTPQFASSYAETIYDESEVTVAPRMTTYPIIKRPPTLKGKAETVLSLIITPEGEIVVEDVISQTEGPFTIAVIASVKAAEFYPGLLHGTPVATRMSYSISTDKSRQGTDFSLGGGITSSPIKIVNTPSYDLSPK